MINNYLEIKKSNILPRLPLEGKLDLTYRCNNNCRHCWLRIPPGSLLKRRELPFKEIRKISDDAKRMGCRDWCISGGEPMLRPDFYEIFDYLTGNCNSYSINTNGILITSKIARLLKRKGVKMVALYGATAKVHDYITRNPGSFEATMRGFRYLKEAHARFTVQLIPMKDNYYQFKEMVRLAESLSKHYRIGAAWLFLSACGDTKKNKEIIYQRLPPEEVIKLDKPDLSYEDSMGERSGQCGRQKNNKYLFNTCINSRRDFHIDPYGKMTFCSFIKSKDLRYDLKKGSFQDCWDNFIPSLATKVKITEEYKKNCGSCELKKDCRFCPVYGYLEHRDFNKKVGYLCTVAKENRRFKDEWQKKHRRYYKIADITIQVDSDLPINDQTFHPKFKNFRVSGPGKDTIFIRHHFSLPDLEDKDLGKEYYRKPPWAIYKKADSWIYLGISPQAQDRRLHRVVVFNFDHRRVKIYNDNDKEEAFLKGGFPSLTLFSTDQILLARILADRQGCYLHSCGVNFKGNGLLFAGHSGAGKSTMAKMLKGNAEILCDDRIIIRSFSDSRQPPTASFNIYGTWSHGDVPDISANSAPLKAILFLKKAQDNRIIKIKDKKDAVKRLLSCLIRPFVTADWWDKTLPLIDRIAQEVPCYVLEFDKSGKAVDLLKKL